MTDVVIQVAPAQATIGFAAVQVTVDVPTITPFVVAQWVPLVTTIISIGTSSISAVPNPTYNAEKGGEAVAA